MKLALSLISIVFLGAAALASDEKYLALPLAPGGMTDSNVLDRYGVSFVPGALPLDNGGCAQVSIGGRVNRIFLLGMTDQISERARTGGSKRAPSQLIRPAVPVDAWTDPLDQSVRFWVGDKLGEIRLNYADGTTDVYPLILGQGVWWGRIFYDYQDPFPTDGRLRRAFAAAIRLYPPGPVADGNYIAVIKPKPIPIRRMAFEVFPAWKGTIGIRGITIETEETNVIDNATLLPPANFLPAFARFVHDHELVPRGKAENRTAGQLQALRLALYSSDQTYRRPGRAGLPPGYSGPTVSFKGSISANVLEDAFYYNVQDIRNKIDATGMYHTSTRGALSWGGYKGIGTFREDFGRYYDTAFSRDMGRSLQEITMLGYTNEARRCADWALRMAHRWETEPRLKMDGLVVPQHWSMLADRPDPGSFNNDGHGLTTLFIYQAWQWLPDRDEWLRSHWPDIKGLGDWILWQFAHPQISRATNGLLYTTSESAGGRGYSVYPDCICMTALRALSEMSDSIGETNSSAQWRARADKMQEAMTEHYIVSDPKYGRVWTLEHAGWPDKSTTLGPLIFAADYEGFAPGDELDAWRSVNEATYQRLIDTYRPFGFYGQAMGYGQGFVSQSALLLDRMHDATTILDWTAREIYDPRFNAFDHFIVPEGVQVMPSGKFWYRIGDLGNGVQEGEIVKTLRLIVGVDDTRPSRLQFFPRMPYGWNEIAVSEYPILFERHGKRQSTLLQYKLRRTGRRMDLKISAGTAPGPVLMRLGPFEKPPEISDVRINGQTPSGALVEHSGDSWWIRFIAGIGTAPG